MVSVREIAGKRQEVRRGQGRLCQGHQAAEAAGSLSGIEGLSAQHAQLLTAIINTAITAGESPDQVELGEFEPFADAVHEVVEQNRQYLGQMDLNARSEAVWDFYDETLGKLRGYGARLVRLDAFAYLHKAVGETNFFNKPGTWDYLDRLKGLAARHGLTLLPEIHAEYGSGLHEEVAANGFPVYDFFLPGLVIDALDRGLNAPLLRWIRELVDKRIRTVNMLGCHDGIPVLDLRGKAVDGIYREGLLSDDEIQAVIDRVMSSLDRRDGHGATASKSHSLRVERLRRRSIARLRTIE